MTVFLGSESLDAEFGRDTIDRVLRKKLLSEGYQIRTLTDRTWRLTKFYAVKPQEV